VTTTTPLPGIPAPADILDDLDRLATDLSQIEDPRGWAKTLDARQRRRLLEALADIVYTATAITGDRP
jgi:hypothetical protein